MVVSGYEEKKEERGQTKKQTRDQLSPLFCFPREGKQEWSNLFHFFDFPLFFSFRSLARRRYASPATASEARPISAARRDAPVRAGMPLRRAASGAGT